jgi:SAM-dependent methyltransferase
MAASAHASLDGGGERYVPEIHAGAMLEPEHHCRYEWIAPLAGGREVLDAGCGVGWGTVILASAGARSVVGVDVDEPAIANARQRASGYATAQIDFRRGDLRELPFGDGSFDLVVCFEAIEHVERPAEVLDELRRVLRADGLLAISSPNRGVYPAGNPFHLHELTTAELSESLEARFRHVAIYSQQTQISSLVAGRAARSAGDTRVITLPGAVDQPVYSVALAADAELPPVASLAVLGAPIDPNEFQPPSLRLQRELETTQDELKRTQEALRHTADAHAAAERARAAADRLLRSQRDSLSWRLTMPLRALKRIALRLKARLIERR